MRNELFNAIASELYLSTLAFAESPERYQVSGPFNREAYHFTRKARAIAEADVARARDVLIANGVDLDPVELGTALAYIRNDHGIDAVDGEPELSHVILVAITAAFRPVYPEFRKRRGKIELNLF